LGSLFGGMLCASPQTPRRRSTGLGCSRGPLTGVAIMETRAVAEGGHRARPEPGTVRFREPVEPLRAFDHGIMNRLPVALEHLQRRPSSSTSDVDRLSMSVQNPPPMGGSKSATGGNDLIAVHFSAVPLPKEQAQGKRASRWLQSPGSPMDSSRFCRAWAGLGKRAGRAVADCDLEIERFRSLWCGGIEQSRSRCDDSEWSPQDRDRGLHQRGTIPNASC